MKSSDENISIRLDRLVDDYYQDMKRAGLTIDNTFKGSAAMLLARRLRALGFDGKLVDEAFNKTNLTYGTF